LNEIVETMLSLLNKIFCFMPFISLLTWNASGIFLKKILMKLESACTIKHSSHPSQKVWINIFELIIESLQ
jgi:hypothetical protein